MPRYKATAASDRIIPQSIRDLARHLNVSIGTVSRALNGRSRRQRRDATPGARCGARTWLFAESVRAKPAPGAPRGWSPRLIPTSQEMPLTDPFFMMVLEGIRRYLGERGLDLVALLCGPEDSADAYLRRVVERRVADAILIAETQREDSRIEYLLERRIPFVAFGRSQSAGSHSWVDLDFEGVAERAVDRLFRLGHRRIAVATKDSEVNYGFVFVGAYKAALERRGIEVDEGIIFRGGGNSEGGYRVGEDLLSAADRPTALVLVDEKMSVGLYRKLGEAGLVPGSDLAIIAFHEGPSSRFPSPKITCFRADLRNLGVRLGEALVASLQPAKPGARRDVIHAIWPMELVPGESDGSADGS